VDNKACSEVLEKRKNIFYLPGNEPILPGGSSISIVEHCLYSGSCCMYVLTTKKFRKRVLLFF
jgi:hypothetical protein